MLHLLSKVFISKKPEVKTKPNLSRLQIKLLLIESKKRRELKEQQKQSAERLETDHFEEKRVVGNFAQVEIPAEIYNGTHLPVARDGASRRGNGTVKSVPLKDKFYKFIFVIFSGCSLSVERGTQSRNSD